ncbi:hypothetical protein P5673_018405 [Acropora cervicornis]|uniref:Uncharacterized protein n=1 Tax=Acropora cervicornis TaxID=6130 RepID=A0AAD9V2Y3_ACRCE|nr:hypothetical protein P5673_018405 [Acropora cervicornis]
MTQSAVCKNVIKISGPNLSVKVTDYFTCISTNVIYCITSTLCKKIYIGETGRRLADRFRENLRDLLGIVGAFYVMRRGREQRYLKMEAGTNRVTEDMNQLIQRTNDINDDDATDDVPLSSDHPS